MTGRVLLMMDHYQGQTRAAPARLRAIAQCPRKWAFEKSSCQQRRIVGSVFLPFRIDFSNSLGKRHSLEMVIIRTTDNLSVCHMFFDPLKSPLAVGHRVGFVVVIFAVKICRLPSRLAVHSHQYYGIAAERMSELHSQRSSRASAM